MSHSWHSRTCSLHLAQFSSLHVAFAAIVRAVLARHFLDNGVEFPHDTPARSLTLRRGRQKVRVGNTRAFTCFGSSNYHTGWTGANFSVPVHVTIAPPAR
ncbi:hypothetical protein [Haliangium ochraceum]|uniref:hypothetical protein n=1 Tax=Haliangium ochraceum TaxID=80816 RepID=UPI000BB47FA0|nr:hypothetical protein [Haliangium ochraceum]